MSEKPEIYFPTYRVDQFELIDILERRRGRPCLGVITVSGEYLSIPIDAWDAIGRPTYVRKEFNLVEKELHIRPSSEHDKHARRLRPPVGRRHQARQPLTAAEKQRFKKGRFPYSIVQVFDAPAIVVKDILIL